MKLQNKRDYINVVHSLGLEIHGTVYTGKPNSASTNAKIPNYVHNHGLLSTADVRQVLRDSKVSKSILQKKLSQRDKDMILDKINSYYF